ncbi:MAG: DNA gyrase subunit A [Oscillospiraceae bacterium]|jgi:DNA gyrase subunit A|nr:DNA gyrase subunit A [Oscillospiraceae bacterium]
MAFDDASLDEQKIINVEIAREMRKSFLDYSMSVITARALPDVRDGLKPVHRRILFTMHRNGLMPDRAYRKCADTVGAVLGSYHPHGDASVYDAMVRLAQDFSMRYMLVDGHGNFGSVDGDPPAAYRYTESRMSKISVEMLANIEKETVEFVPNYDDRLKEPTVLPARFPNLLVNGSTGIAVGMATNIPPHNMVEVIDALCCLIDNPEATLEDLMEHIKGPDFPTAGIIMGRAGIRAAYATGRGKIIVRARAEIREKKEGRFSIHVVELPYVVNKARLHEAIDQLVKDKRIEGVSAVNDYSSRNGMDLVVDLKRDANPQVVLNQLYSFTQMQSTFGVIMIALVNGEPKLLTLKQMLQHYIDFQVEVITRRTQFDLRKARERAHILEALIVAQDHIDEVISLIRSSKSIPEARASLTERFQFDEAQATAIVQMQLGRLTGLEREKLEAETAEIRAQIAEFEALLSDPQKMLAQFKQEVCAIRDRFGDPRRTEIQDISGEVDIEDLIPEETCVYTMTTLGYVKRQPMDTYQSQHRGGRGIKGLTRREEDVVQTMFTCSTHDYVMVFTTRGRVYRLKGYEIPEGSRNSKGMNIVNILPISGEESVSAMIQVPNEERAPDLGEHYLCMVTRQGVIKRTALSEYRNVRKNGVIALNLDEDDELAWVHLTSGAEELIIATRGGMAIRFRESDARPLGRTARGVRAIQLAEGDEVVGFDVIAEGKSVLTVSESGLGRRSLPANYRLQSRAGKGLTNYHTERFGRVAAVAVVEETDDLILIASDGVIIRIPAGQISTFNRPGKGVRVMKISAGERVIAMACVPASEEEPIDALPVAAEGETEDGNAEE